jgi:hypothetical protein
MRRQRVHYGHPKWSIWPRNSQPARSWAAPSLNRVEAGAKISSRRSRLWNGRAPTHSKNLLMKSAEARDHCVFVLALSLSVELFAGNSTAAPHMTDEIIQARRTGDLINSLGVRTLAFPRGSRKLFSALSILAYGIFAMALVEVWWSTKGWRAGGAPACRGRLSVLAPRRGRLRYLIHSSAERLSGFCRTSDGLKWDSRTIHLLSKLSRQPHHDDRYSMAAVEDMSNIICSWLFTPLRL